MILNSHVNTKTYSIQSKAYNKVAASGGMSNAVNIMMIFTKLAPVIGGLANADNVDKILK